MFILNIMKHYFTLTLLFLISKTVFSEVFFSAKELSNIYMQPSVESPIIYPIELGKKLILKKNQDEWANVLDEKTGLVGWIQKEMLSKEKPKNSGKGKDYESSFIIFEERVMEMSKSIKEAISIETFISVEHLGGAAAAITADNEWFKGRRHANQAFQVYDLWKNQNQSPSFLSFRNESGEEQFIILSGPHRPRYLKSTK